MSYLDHLYMGTWQFGGQFKLLSEETIVSLVKFATESEIGRFDTAAVYGGGKVESILGRCLPKDAVVVTKIPALKNPKLRPLPVEDCYPVDHLARSLESSLNRLRRARIDTVLLHNWTPLWSNVGGELVLESLTALKHEGMVDRIGISLPDGFWGEFSQPVLKLIDVIEAPFNSREQWVIGLMPQLHRAGKEVLLRSLFRQGTELAIRSSREILSEACAQRSSLVVGMTTQLQITENIHTIRRCRNEQW